MPSMETSYRRQKALLWAANGFDLNGLPARATVYVELDVRWNNNRTKSMDNLGNVIALDALVVVDRDVAVGSVMWEGSAHDLAEALPGTGSSTADVPTSGLFEVKTFKKTNDIKGRAIRRTCGLQRIGDFMPGTS